MEDNRIRPGVWLTVVGLIAVLAVVLALLQARRPSRAPGVEPQPPETPIASVATAPQPFSPPSDPQPITRTPPAAQEPVPYVEGLVFGDVDLREARELMPDNLYWQTGAPTKDPAVLEAREQENRRRNEEYGRVLSGDASEDEVRAYYDYRKRLSSDYLEFADFMNRRFGNSVNDEFKGLLELSMKLHAARLAQIPADLDEALERARSREKIRQEWRREQEEFADPAAGSDAPR